MGVFFSFKITLDFLSVAKTEQKGRLVWRKQNTQKVPSRLLPQGIQPFLALVGVLFLGETFFGTLRLHSVPFSHYITAPTVRSFKGIRKGDIGREAPAGLHCFKS